MPFFVGRRQLPAQDSARPAGRAQRWTWRNDWSITVADRVAGRNNNFGLMRFVAASLVVLSHSFALTGSFRSDPLIRLTGNLDLGSAAVIVFFVMSGFLVTRSAFLSPNLARYVRARLLRIWPALILTAVFTALVLGAIATALPLSQYFRQPDTWRYAALVPLLDVGRLLPGTFLTNPVPRGVNGSLWTIQVEAWLYLVVGCLILLRITRHAAAFNAFLVLAVLAYAFFPGPLLAWIPRHDEPITPSFVGCFMLGAAIYANARFVPLSFLACGVLIAATIARAGTQAFAPLFYVTFSYCVVCLALHPQLYIARWNDHVDYSYGIYVFAFPIQQTLISLMGPVHPIVFFLICYPIIFVVATACWHFVESRALALKE
jgi:peptidoglycan/LPS O-acetylase OafA/YrhL